MVQWLHVFIAIGKSAPQVNLSLYYLFLAAIKGVGTKLWRVKVLARSNEMGHLEGQGAEWDCKVNHDRGQWSVLGESGALCERPGKASRSEDTTNQSWREGHRVRSDCCLWCLSVSVSFSPECWILTSIMMACKIQLTFIRYSPCVLPSFAANRKESRTC